MASSDQRRGIQSIEIGFRIVDFIESAPQSLSLTEIARGIGLSPSRVQFYLVSLLRVGIVEQDGPGGRYHLGPKAIRLGISALAQVDVVEAARARMFELRDKTGDTVFLSVWGTHGPTVINRLNGLKVAPLEVPVGAIMPLLSSATGRTFLAFLPPSVTSKLLRSEMATVKRHGGSRPNDSEQKRVIAEVRSHGIARVRGGVISGIVAIAAPVVDFDGRLRCVLTLMGHEGLLDTEYRGRAARALSEATRSASRAGGFSGEIWPTRMDAPGK